MGVEGLGLEYGLEVYSLGCGTFGLYLQGSESELQGLGFEIGFSCHGAVCAQFTQKQHAQRLQYWLIKEYTLNCNRIPNMI